MKTHGFTEFDFIHLQMMLRRHGCASEDQVQEMLKDRRMYEYDLTEGGDAMMESNDCFGSYIPVTIKKIFKTGGVHLIDKTTGSFRESHIRNLRSA